MTATDEAAASNKGKRDKPAVQKGYIVILRDRCKGCDLCIPVCPVDIIEKAGPEQVNWMGWIPVRVSDMTRCIACKLCALVCPDLAIDVYKFDGPLHPPAAHRQAPQHAWIEDQGGSRRA